MSKVEVNSLSMLDTILITLVALAGAFFLCLVIVHAGDSFTTKVIGERVVECLDSRFNVIQETYCYESVTFSKLGLSGDYKCSEVEGYK